MTLARVSRIGRYICVAMLLALIGVGAFAQNKDAATPHVQLTWAPTETLSEVKDNQARRGWLRPEEWMKTLGDYLRKRADLVLPPGQQLKVTIDDIKLAGDYEPWRGPDAQDIRILSDLYPPRINLHYTLRGSDGTMLREGTHKLRDAAFLQRMTASSTDPLRYDKRLIDDWLRKEFGRGNSG